MGIYRHPPYPQTGVRFVPQEPPAVDDPPFTSALRAGTMLALVLGLWLPTPPIGQLPIHRFLVQEAAAEADSPPPQNRTPFDVILRAWQVEPTRFIPVRVVPPPSIDDPPFSARARPDLTRWALEPALFIAPRLLSPAIPGQSVDDPPPSRSAADVLARAWSAPIGAWRERRVLLVQGADVVDDPPFARRRADRIDEAWRVLPPAPVPRAGIVQEFITAADDPPFYRTRVAQEIIRRAWQREPDVMQLAHGVVQVVSDVTADVVLLVRADVGTIQVREDVGTIRLRPETGTVET